jgi:hypothetical protein
LLRRADNHFRRAKHDLGRLRAINNDLQAECAAKDSEIARLQARNAELEATVAKQPPSEARFAELDPQGMLPGPRLESLLLEKDRVKWALFAVWSLKTALVALV